MANTESGVLPNCLTSAAVHCFVFFGRAVATFKPTAPLVTTGHFGSAPGYTERAMRKAGETLRGQLRSMSFCMAATDTGRCSMADATSNFTNVECLDADPMHNTDIAALNEEAEEAARRKGRCARFKVQVVAQYQFTCALTGLSCLTSEGATTVDAAHIEPWAASQNDALTNGLALSKNAHWSFDEGLWSVASDGRICIAKNRFQDNGPEALRLGIYAGRFLQFADKVSLRPDPECFLRHRRFHGIST